MKKKLTLNLNMVSQREKASFGPQVAKETAPKKKSAIQGGEEVRKASSDNCIAGRKNPDKKDVAPSKCRRLRKKVWDTFVLKEKDSY